MNIVLKHSVSIKTLSFPTFRRFLEALRAEWRFASFPERENENIKYLISPNGSRTHNFLRGAAPQGTKDLLRYSRTLVPLRHDWPDSFAFVKSAFGIRVFIADCHSCEISIRQLTLNIRFSLQNQKNILETQKYSFIVEFMNTS